MNKLKSNIFFKIATILVITLLLMIPATMIRGIINERETTQNEAISEVSSKWAEQQILSGPFISIPYIKMVRENADTVSRLVPVKEYIHVMPEELNISGDITPERRNRGIYEIVVYNSKITLKGKFNKVNLAALDIPINSIIFDKAEFVIGINDLRGIEKPANMNWNGNQVVFNPGVSSKDVVSSGINAMVVFSDTMNYNFSVSLDLKGSQLLYFTPVGKVTDVKISSDWPDPSFDGAFLPDSRNVSAKGFDANWNVLHLNRNYPQLWTGTQSAFGESAFGINLRLPVDNYQKSYRSIKYAILFIAFTFLVFFFIEVLKKVFIHPVQYILVGMALIVFYTLLLSLSEHLNFNRAFIVSAVATLLLVAGYVKAILHSRQLMLLISGILAILYSFIFVTIQLQDYALLIGSIGVFIILALVMFFSRKIDWYNLNLNEK